MANPPFHAEHQETIDALGQEIDAEKARADKAERLCEKYARRTIERSERIAELEGRLDVLASTVAMRDDVLQAGTRLVMRHGDEPDLDREPTGQELADALSAHVSEGGS